MLAFLKINHLYKIYIKIENILYFMFPFFFILYSSEAVGEGKNTGKKRQATAWKRRPEAGTSDIRPWGQ